MRLRLFLVVVGLSIFLTGLLVAISGNVQVGAIMVLCAAGSILGSFLSTLNQLYRESSGWNWQILFYCAAFFTGAIIFLHGFSASINVMMAFSVKSFTGLFIVSGFLLPVLLFMFSVQLAHPEDKLWVTIGSLISALLSLFGFLAFIRVIPFPPITILYSWVFLLFFYLVFLTKRYVTSKNRIIRQESLRLLLISLLFAGFWYLRFMMVSPMADGTLKAIVHLGMVPLLLLPLSTVSIRRLYPYLVFLFYFVLLDVYFIQYDSSFNYLVTVGTDRCEGYDQSTDYPVTPEPGISLQELMKEPTQEELDQIRQEWLEEDFSPHNIQIVHQERLQNGDSIKVISHLVNGFIHYGAIRIPYGLSTSTAPILLVLEGGGTGLDVANVNKLTRARCREQSNQFLSILPSYRGCIIRGDHFCFRSEGYFGDPWLGPAEDAVAFLEVVKHLYQKGDQTKVLASGLSRGATVAFMIGGLTEKLDYLITTSSHTKFLDEHVVLKERVGQSFPRAFYTPIDSPSEIRKRLIVSSPYFFAEKLPPFELHQGMLDQQTTIWHAYQLRDRLVELSRDPETYQIHIYQDQGHGYDDDEAICESFAEFLVNSTQSEPSR